MELRSGEQVEHIWIPLASAYGGHFIYNQDHGAKTQGLAQRTGRELLTSDAVRKSRIVFDARAGARLAAGRVALDEDVPQTF